MTKYNKLDENIPMQENIALLLDNSNNILTITNIVLLNQYINKLDGITKFNINNVIDVILKNPNNITIQIKIHNMNYYTILY